MPKSLLKNVEQYNALDRADTSNALNWILSMRQIQKTETLHSLNKCPNCVSKMFCSLSFRQHTRIVWYVYTLQKVVNAAKAPTSWLYFSLIQNCSFGSSVDNLVYKQYTSFLTNNFQDEFRWHNHKVLLTHLKLITANAKEKRFDQMQHTISLDSKKIKTNRLHHEPPSRMNCFNRILMPMRDTNDMTMIRRNVLVMNQNGKSHKVFSCHFWITKKWIHSWESQLSTNWNYWAMKQNWIVGSR